MRGSSASGRTAGPGGSIQGSGALCSGMCSVCVGEGPQLPLPKGSSLNPRIRPIQGLGSQLPENCPASPSHVKVIAQERCHRTQQGMGWDGRKAMVTPWWPRRGLVGC